ncbi:MAG: hypothetical protein JXB34_07505 [Bacteroidales bacterium]|nr:hypothetical protein [Bacteroidales bacterium]
MAPVDFYNQQKELANSKIAAFKRKLSANALFRLISFGGIFIVLYALLRVNTVIAISGSAGCLIVFLLLIGRNVKLQKGSTYFKSLLTIAENEIDALNYDFRGFRNGTQYINSRHSYSYDLDLFGQGSAFAMLNRTVTCKGEKLLAEALLSDETVPENIEGSQEAIKELASKPGQMLHFRTTGMTSEALNDEGENEIKKWCAKKSYIGKHKTLRFLIYFFPVITLSALIGSFFISGLFSVFIVMYLLNMGLVGLNMRKTNNEHQQISSFLRSLEKYQGLISAVDCCSYNARQLSAQAGRLKLNRQPAAKTLKQLTRLVSAFDGRLNMFAAMFLEGLFLYDYHCLYAIEKWRGQFGEKLPEWLDVVAYFDSKVSLATYAYNNPGFTYPEVSAKIVLQATGLGHPLIPHQVRVCNNFSIESPGGFVIVTGANMAGKSTFLRTVGLNLLLAKAGLPVCAGSFSFSPLKLFTSMRTSDSLAENESYFYAELRRLKEILIKLEKDGAMFIILDEILKGTNSVDKQKGSYLVLEKIIRMNGTGIIATHDLALTAIEGQYPAKVKNQCFEIEIDNARISFDYKLYNGVTQKMNAMLLMEQMGII